MQEAGGCPQGASGMGVRGRRRGAPEADRALFSKFSWLSSEEARLQLCPKASLGLSPTPDATSELMTPPSM